MGTVYVGERLTAPLFMSPKARIHIDEAEYLVIDFETTGLSAEGGDRVCELGAVKLRGGAVVDTFGTLINPQRPISSGAYAVNRISPQMIANAPAFADIAERLWDMMQGTVLVAYNAPFDLSFLTYEFRLAAYPRITHPVVDALAIARQLLPGLGKYSQDNVARVLGIPFPVKHRALEDAMVTARLFTLFASILKAYDCSAVTDLTRRDLLRTLHERRISVVNDALSKGWNLWIKYLSPTGSEITDRIISPTECVEASHGSTSTTYLIAYCHTAKAERQFRIDRMLDIRLMNPVAV